MPPKNPFPGVSRFQDRHGKTRWRLRRVVKGHRINCMLPGAYGSPEFRTAYEGAHKGLSVKSTRSDPGTLAWLIEKYKASPRYQDTSLTRRKTLAAQLDWLKEVAGEFYFSDLKPIHVEAIMAKKDGPTAANAVKKNLSMLYNFATAKMGYTGINSAKFADRRKESKTGYHTWTTAEVNRFLERHGPGTKARLVMLLALNTGMSRQDIAKAGRQHVSQGRIAYSRGKTGESADMPIMPELAVELAALPPDQMMFVLRDDTPAPFSVPGLGNWFRKRCDEAGVPGSLHGLRKAGAVRLAEAGASEDEVAAFLAHAGTGTAHTYTRAARKSVLADAAIRRLKE